MSAPDSPPVPSPRKVNDEPAVSHWADIVRAVKTPLGLFSLAMLVISPIPALVFVRTGMEAHAGTAIHGMFIILGLVIVGVVTIALIRPEIFGTTSNGGGGSGENRIAIPPPQIPRGSQKSDVMFANEGPAKLDYWYREIQPLLHQAAHYSVPMYYLDEKLRVMDWNVAFGVVFHSLAGEIRGKHVNTFINRMHNYNDVYNHAKIFSRNVIENRAFPYVDIELIEYVSPDFGLARFLKVATQLTNRHGVGRGWAVALMPMALNWPVFEERLARAIHDDKMWSVYSASYDRVLRVFPPYRQLIDDVIRVIPNPSGMPPFSTSVLDVGAGTGNVSAALVERKFRVTAIENNLGMLDRFVAKPFDVEQVRIIKASVENLEFLENNSFDAAVMVNVLYALEQPMECLRRLFAALRPNGILSLSTTHSETDLDPLLKEIEGELTRTGKSDELGAEWENVYRTNKVLERTIVRRHSREQVREMVKSAGFVITNEVPSAYCGAVMILHARKPARDLTDSAQVNQE